MISERIASLFEGYNWMIIPAALITIILHEMSHGFVAYLLGDRTAKNAGRLTLNPIKHLDPFGLFAMIVFGFGWAKPVPVNPYYFKNRKGGMALTAFAGPLSNLLLAFLGVILLSLIDGIVSISNGLYYTVGISDVMLGIAIFLWYFVILNVGLAIFNLIPIPPLDGSKILGEFLSGGAKYKYLSFERYGSIVLLLVFAIRPLNSIFSSVLGFLQGLILSGYLKVIELILGVF